MSRAAIGSAVRISRGAIAKRSGRRAPVAARRAAATENGRAKRCSQSRAPHPSNLILIAAAAWELKFSSTSALSAVRFFSKARRVPSGGGGQGGRRKTAGQKE